MFPNAAVPRVGNLHRRHPRRMVASALHHDPSPPLQAVGADLNPLSELTINGRPGLRVGRGAVEYVVGGSCAGEDHFSPESDGEYCEILFFLFVQVFDFLGNILLLFLFLFLFLFFFLFLFIVFCGQIPVIDEYGLES